jgi:hypothetical protein
MLPAFDEFGNLPPGIHRATIDEVVQRFGSGSAERDAEGQELHRFIEWARRADVRRMVVNGSFVTAQKAPNDVDLIILPGPDYPRGQQSPPDEEVLWPFLHILVAADDDDLELWAFQDFGTDRNQRPKGVVEVIL